MVWDAKIQHLFSFSKYYFVNWYRIIENTLQILVHVFDSFLNIYKSVIQVLQYHSHNPRFRGVVRNEINEVVHSH